MSGVTTWEFRGDINHQIAQIAVWAVFKDRIEQGMTLCESRGCTLSEAEMYDLGTHFRGIWQMDVPRDVRSACFLCRQDLPPSIETLCKCFRSVQLGVYIDPITPVELANYQRMYPDSWQEIQILTYQCKRCDELVSPTLRLAASKFSKGKTWKNPKFCQGCYIVMQRARDARALHQPRPMRNPTLTAPLVDRKKLGKIDLTKLQELAGATAPPVAKT